LYRSCLCGDDVRALRACCTPLRDAVDAQVGALDQGIDGAAAAGADTAASHVLSAAACARLCGVSTVTLRSMACMRAMRMGEQPGAFPRLQSLRLLLSTSRYKVGEEGALMAAVRACAPCTRPLPTHTHTLAGRRRRRLAGRRRRRLPGHRQHRSVSHPTEHRSASVRLQSLPASATAA
jgi:hypothetical protein